MSRENDVPPCFYLSKVTLSVTLTHCSKMEALETMLMLLNLLLATASAEYLMVPHAPSEPQWSTNENHVRPRTSNSSLWPYGPFSTRGRDIVNARGEAVTWAGVNWPLSGETMIPEGLEWASAEHILDDVASVGFNFIRM